MKNLTVKKVALGLFLAGYAASSAFALNAITSKVIEGNLPILKSNLANPADHTMTVEIRDQDHPDNKIGSRPAKVKDIIRIEFNLTDDDGDIMSADNIQNTLSVFVKKKKDDASEPWTPIAKSDLKDLKTEITNDGLKGVISFEITDAFAGAEKIGYQILERTDYGTPFANKWLLVTDIWSNTAPNPVDPTDLTKPTTTGPTDPKDGTHGPGDSTDNGSGPVESSKTKIGIFKFTGAAIVEADDYSRVADAIPKYGEKFAAVVWMDDNDDGKLDTGEVSKTGSYTFTWTLSGEYDYVELNQAAAGTAKKPPKPNETITVGVTNGTGPWDTGTNNVIFLGSDDVSTTKHNKKYDTAYYPAGAQGYNLKVTTN